MSTATIADLRDALFSTLASLQDKTNPMEIDRAGAICNVAREITATAKIEIDFMRATGASSGSNFIALESPATPKKQTPTQNGSKQIETLPGGSITTHRMR